MRLAGRFGRRVRGWAKKHGIPVIDCRVGDRKHEIGEQYMPTDPTFTGIFCVLISRAPVPIWDVQRYGNNRNDRSRGTRAGRSHSVPKPKQAGNRPPSHAGVTMGAVFAAGCRVIIRFRDNQATWAATGLAWATASGSVSQRVYGNQSFASRSGRTGRC